MTALLNQLRELKLDGILSVLVQMQETGEAGLTAGLPLLNRIITAEAEYSGPTGLDKKLSLSA
jgi:hypothetical protein